VRKRTVTGRKEVYREAGRYQMKRRSRVRRVKKDDREKEFGRIKWGRITKKRR